MPEAQRDWPAEFDDQLSRAECYSLQIISLRADYKVIRGGSATVTNNKKTAVIRAAWRKTDVEANLHTENAKKAFKWLMENNPTYEEYVKQHRRLLRQDRSSEDWHIIKTADLLLHLKGVEVAARPWLYPRASFGDSDIKHRLICLNRLKENHKPSIKASWLRKLLSRCTFYEEDFELFSLLHDISLARQISSVVSIAKNEKIAPEEAASSMQNFDTYWHREQEKLEDMCRQQQERQDQDPEFVGDPSGLPNRFVTIAPGEWTEVCSSGASKPILCRRDKP